MSMDILSNFDFDKDIRLSQLYLTLKVMSMLANLIKQCYNVESL